MILRIPGPNAQEHNGPEGSLVPHILLREPSLRGGALSSSTRVKRNGGGVSPHYMSLQERLHILAFKAYMALVYGFLMPISAREGKSGWAWFWALAFVATSLRTSLLFWRGPEV
jgi:hypothetical protein